MRVLCISNGHGEDVIAVKVLTALRAIAPTVSLAALPIVGEGSLYRKAQIAIAGPTQTLPSGGFIYMDHQQLARDLQGGLVQLAWTQLQAVRQWARQPGVILTVGDLVPLAFGWFSGLPYGFIGTAKSDYTLRDAQGNPEHFSVWAHWDRRARSVYLPWERWLMQQSRCRCVFPRDTLTTHQLRHWKIPAFDAGNPMMDGFVVPPFEPPNRQNPDSLSILLLPGSRVPEAYANWPLILTALESALATLNLRSITVLAAIAPALDCQALSQALIERGWHETANGFQRQQAQLQLSTTRFMDYCQQAQVAIAMAGTATEQFVGLGKPAITLPGPGPQFNPAFARAQTRLLGESVVLVAPPQQVGDTLQTLMRDTPRLQRIYKNGLQRMGPPGAGQRIAEILREKLWD
jgi:uncharacterized protein (TIGR03492 family)